MELNEFQLNIQQNILALSILIPMIGAICIATVRGKNANNIAIWSSAFVLLLCSWLCICIDKSQYSHVMFFGFAGSLNAISIYMIELTAITIFSGIIAKNNTFPEFFITILLMESALIILFFNTDIFLFTFIFEMIVILASFIFICFEEKYKTFFILMTAAAFMVFFCSIYMLNISGTSDMQILKQYSFSRNRFVLFSLWSAFSIICGLFPFHISYSKSSPMIKMLISGIFLSIGAFGFITILLPLSQSKSYRMCINIMALMSIISATMKAYKNHNFESLSDCISSSYLALIVIGIFSFSYQGVNSAIFGMIIYSLIFTGIYILIYKDNQIGISQLSLIQLTAIIIFVLCGISVPLFPGFPFLFSILTSIFEQRIFLVIFSAVWLLAMIVVLTIFNDIIREKKIVTASINIFWSVPLLFIMYAGIFPNRILVSLEDSVKASSLLQTGNRHGS